VDQNGAKQKEKISERFPFNEEGNRIKRQKTKDRRKTGSRATCWGMFVEQMVNKRVRDRQGRLEGKSSRPERQSRRKGREKKRHRIRTTTLKSGRKERCKENFASSRYRFSVTGAQRRREFILTNWTILRAIDAGYQR